MAKLKTCPFCGGEAEFIYIAPYVHPLTGRKGLVHWQVACDNCGVVTAGMLSEEDAAEAWNRRVENAKSAD